MLCPGCQRLVALHCRLPEGPDLVWKKLGGELPPQHQLTRNALRLQRVNINTTSKKNETKKGQTFWADHDGDLGEGGGLWEVYYTGCSLFIKTTTKTQQAKQMKQKNALNKQTRWEWRTRGGTSAAPTAGGSGSTSLSLKVRLLMITMVMVIWVVVRFWCCHPVCCNHTTQKVENTSCISFWKLDFIATLTSYRVFFFFTGPPPKMSKYRKVNLG